ncbi:MAG: cytochrome c family protein [Phycisphaerales bacterium]|nr:MAG: cytochrome c family protein [Phycisphaerales bacterium]
MKPCGCSGKQLGGLDRRDAIFRTVPKEKRLIVDTGSLVDGGEEQDLIKFDIIVQAFNLLGYDLVHLTDTDVEVAGNKVLLDSIGSLFDVIAAPRSADVNVPAKYTRQFALKDGAVAVTIAAVDPQVTSAEQIQELFGSQPGAEAVNMVILSRSDSATVDSIVAQAPAVDCVICPPESDEPRAVARRQNRLLVFSPGRLGKYVTRLQIYPELKKPTVPRRAEAQEAGTKEILSTTHSGLQIAFSAVPITEDLPQESSQVQLYQTYQLLLKETNILQRLPRFTLPDDLEYAGSLACAICHDEVYQKWRSTRHANAYATLERVGSQYDPECVICHVIGLEYKSGFVSPELTPDMKDVGCENCHGPASEHAATAGAVELGRPRSTCVDCHSPEHSTDFAGNEARYRQKIVHWTEQNSSSNVK